MVTDQSKKLWEKIEKRGQFYGTWGGGKQMFFFLNIYPWFFLKLYFYNAMELTNSDTATDLLNNITVNNIHHIAIKEWT